MQYTPIHAAVVQARIQNATLQNLNTWRNFHLVMAILLSADCNACIAGMLGLCKKAAYKCSMSKALLRQLITGIHRVHRTSPCHVKQCCRPAADDSSTATSQTSGGAICCFKI